MQQWTRIWSTQQYTQAAVVKGMLEKNDIPVKILNKQDAMYPVIGEIELYVPVHLKLVADQLIHHSLLN